MLADSGSFCHIYNRKSLHAKKSLLSISFPILVNISVCCTQNNTSKCCSRVTVYSDHLNRVNSNCYVLVFCLVYITSKYTSKLLLLLLKSISFYYRRCCYFFVLSFLFCFLHYYYYLLLSYFFACSHAPLCKMRRDNFRLVYSFSLYLFISPSLFVFLLVIFSSSAPRAGTRLPLFTIDYILLGTKFFAQAFCIKHIFWTVSETHVWKFNLHSFRFVDFLTFISICPPIEHSTAIEQRFKSFENFDTQILFYFLKAFDWQFDFLFISGKGIKEMRSHNRKFIEKRSFSTAVINDCVSICSEAVWIDFCFCLCCHYNAYSFFHYSFKWFASTGVICFTT